VIGPVLREYIIGEAMHALGVPTTRALAAVTPAKRSCGRTVPNRVRCWRGWRRAICASARSSSSPRGAKPKSSGNWPTTPSPGTIRTLPGQPDRYLGLLGAVRDRQAALIAKWMHLGFVHGVMNTDNMTISGETIDYGPCAFIDGYDPATVFSSIDHTAAMPMAISRKSPSGTWRGWPKPCLI
jgi:uncharacterized protein YdiU (UPF0061 family)